ncbi:Flp pilus assembly protein CpaB [Nordella sp. HKS 07]|uniref:Flp pilus assembly protein CpaB n=1 Tax=Nordella sp. HKS 07 TaxID=2712222 RepID=UPI0013E1462F|nr:Flp pilus assembly protein CpaB [Nordella sp. HKS 07]QIG48833.1 Flp pilus assembly protein CpaB [Nordella sp. HKS 07]
MNRTRLLVLAVAFGSAGLAIYMAKGLVGTKKEVKTVEVSKVETVDVLVATKNLQMGEKLVGGSIGWQSWPKATVAATMITSEANPEAKTKYETARARTAIYEGEPVIEKKLVLPTENGFMSAILPKGMRAVSVPVSAETGAGGFILPNDRVDVLLTRKIDDGSNQKSSISETVLTNVRVLAIDQTFRPKGEDDKEYVVADKTATLELDPRQTEVISMTQDVGQLSLTLRSIRENDGVPLADIVPRLSEKYANGTENSEMTIIRYGIPRRVTLN